MTRDQQVAIEFVISDAIAYLEDVKSRYPGEELYCPYLIRLEDSIRMLDEAGVSPDTLHAAVKASKPVQGVALYTETEKDLIDQFREQQDAVPNGVSILITVPEDIDPALATELVGCTLDAVFVAQIQDEFQFELECTDPNCIRCF